MMVRAPALRRGDVVRVIAPASAFDREAFERGLGVLRDTLGLVPRFRDDLFSKAGYLAGDDARRAAELNEAIADREARAIWCARGGYGAMRILQEVKWERLLRAPKLFVGFSDVTALHAVLNRLGLVTVHGPMVAKLATTPPRVLTALRELLFDRGARPTLRGAAAIAPGRAEGPLLGGNLALLAHLCGTGYFPPLRGAVLALEEVTEKPYRVDRTLTQLELAGALAGVAGVAVGHVVECDDAETKAIDVIAERLSRMGVPVVRGFSFGHEDENVPLPLGARARLDAQTLELELLEGATA